MNKEELIKVLEQERTEEYKPLKTKATKLLFEKLIELELEDNKDLNDDTIKFILDYNKRAFRRKREGT